MIQKVVPVLLFAVVAIVLIQLINLSFSRTYKQVEASVKAPYARAQQIYEVESQW